VFEIKIYHRLDYEECRGMRSSIPGLPAVVNELQDRVERGKRVTKLRHHDGELAAVMNGVQS